MVEREIRSKEEFLEFLNELKDAKHIDTVNLEKKSGIGRGTIFRWDKASTTLNTMLKVLSFLDAKMVLRTDELKEEHAESESEKTEEVETMDTEHGDTEISELDKLILNSAEKALKNCNSLSEKERLYKILQAFL